MEDNDFKQMKQLYERFIEDMHANGRAAGYYEKDDLIDIFGVASDEGDSLTQMYVFLTAARLYPSDPFLDSRLAYHLLKIGDIDAAFSLLDWKGDKKEPLWDMLSIELRYTDELPDLDISSDVAAFIDRHEQIDGETLIRLVDFLKGYDRLDLLVEHFPSLRKKVDDVAALLYEVADAIDMADQESEATLKMSEELTTLEPFNSDNWILHADQAASLGHYDDALQAIDYALALRPDDSKALLLKGCILLLDKRDIKEGERILKQTLADEPSNYMAARNLARSYAERGMTEAAFEVYIAFLENNPSNQIVFWEAARLMPDRLHYLLNAYGKQAGIDDNLFINCSQTGIYDERLTRPILEESARRDTNGFMLKEYLRRLYAEGEYSKILEIARERGEMADIFDIEGEAIIAASMLRLHLYEEAASVAEQTLKMFPTRNSVGEAFYLKGARQILKRLRDYALAPSTIPTDPDFDPLN